MTRVLRAPLPDSHWAALDLMALCTGRSRAELVRNALEQHIPAGVMARARADTEANQP